MKSMEFLIIGLFLIFGLIPLMANSWKWLTRLSIAAALYGAGLWGYLIYWRSIRPPGGMDLGTDYVIGMLAVIVIVSSIITRFVTYKIQAAKNVARWKLIPVDIALFTGLLIALFFLTTSVLNYVMSV